MKNTISLFLCICFSLQLSAQTKFELFPGWGIKHIGASVGEDQDMVNGLSQEYLLQTVRGGAPELETREFDRTDVTSMICENPHFRFDVALLPPGTRNLELRLASVGIFGRIDEVSYFSGNRDGEYESLSVSATSSELALETSLLKHGKIGNSLSLYGGLGTNLGVTFNGTVSVQESYARYRGNSSGGGADDAPQTQAGPAVPYSEWEFYDQRNGITQRAFAHAGMGIRFFKRVEIGMEYRYGIGYRAMASAPTVRTNLHSGALTARWLMK